MTALHLAADRGPLELIDELLAKGANTEAKDSKVLQCCLPLTPHRLCRPSPQPRGIRTCTRTQPCW